jgi:hypothetical protein
VERFATNDFDRKLATAATVGFASNFPSHSAAQKKLVSPCAAQWAPFPMTARIMNHPNYREFFPDPVFGKSSALTPARREAAYNSLVIKGLT